MPKMDSNLIKCELEARNIKELFLLPGGLNDN